MDRKMLVWVSFMIILLAVAGASGAEARSIQSTWVSSGSGYDADAYHCTDTNRCSAVSGQAYDSYVSGTTAYISYSVAVPTGQAYMGSYYFTKECYIPKEFWLKCTTDCTITTNIGSFNKKANCKSAINSWSVSSPREIGTPIDIDASLKSAFSNPYTIPDYVPPALIDEHYSSEIDATLTVKRGSSVVYTDVESVNIPWDGSEGVSYSWTPSECGSYTITLETTVPDCQCSSTVKDTKTVSFEIPCADNPPEIDVEIEPKPSYPEDNLACNADVSDVDGDLDHIDFKWYVNGVLVRSQTKSVSGFSDTESDTLSSSFTEEGDFVTCEGKVYDSVSHYDSDVDETYIDTPYCHKPPEVVQIEITPKLPVSADNLDCDVEVYDIDGNLHHVMFKWHVNGVIVRTYERDVSGFSDFAADQLSYSFTEAGDEIICEAIVYDDIMLYDSGLDDSFIGEGENYPPVVDYVGITPSSPETEDSLLCEADVSDTDGNLYDMTFKWYVNGGLVRTQVKSASGFSDTDTDTLSSGYTDYEDEVKCEVTVRDSDFLSDSDYSLVSVASVPQPCNDPPIVTSVDITPSNPEATDELYCDAVLADTNGNLDHVLFKWHVDGTIVRTQERAVSGYSDSESDTLPFTMTSYGDEVICEVIVYDSEYLYGSKLDTVNVAECASDPPPVVESICLTPTDPDTTDTLQCSVEVSDLDGDLDDLEFRWRVDGILVRTQVYSVYGYTDSRIDLLSSSMTETGDHVICEVKVVDQTSAFDEDQDDVVIGSSGVPGSPPSVQDIDMIPTTPGVNDDITCNAYVSDSDGNLEYIDFRWYVNGLLKRSVTKSVAGYSDTETDTLQDMYTGYGNVVKCDVQVWDTTDLSDHDYQQVTLESAYQGSPPDIRDLPDRWTEVAQGIAEIDLWDYASDTEDPDYNLDFSISSQSHDELIDCYISSNRYLRCHDAEGGGYSDITVRVEDTQSLWDTDTMRVWIDEFCGGSCDRDPVLDSMDIIPSDPEDNDDIRCEAEVSDPDGDLDYMEFKWFVEGDLVRTRTKDVSGYSDSDYDVLPDSETDDGDEVKCYIEVYDQEGNDDSDYEKVWVGYDNGDDDDEDCNIDLYELDAEDGEISFKIKNKGNEDMDVTYRIYIDDDKEYQKTVEINDGDTRTFYYDDYDFEEDQEYEIEVRAEAECGDTEKETIWYVYGDDYSGSCGVEIRNYDYTQSLEVDGYAWVEAQVKNTGRSKTYMSMRIYLDNVQVGLTSFWLEKGETQTKSISFRPSVSGTKTLRIVVDATCGASDSAYGTMYIGGEGPGPVPGQCNYNGVCESGESWYACPYDCPEPGPSDSGPTSVEIRPSALDVSLYKSKIITIDIDSYLPQEFQVTVEGVPEDWLDYKASVWVDDEKNTYIFISPKQGGHHQFMVNVRSVTEGITYRKQIDMFVATPDQDSGMDGFTGMLIGGASNVWTLLILIIALAAVLVYFASRKMKHHHDVKMISFPRREREF